MKNGGVGLLIFLVTILLYLAAVIYWRDFGLLNNTLFGDYPADYKLKILQGVVVSLPYSLPGWQGIFLLVITGLTGLNVSMIARRLSKIRSKGRLGIFMGGGAALGIGTAGCAVCGLPFLAFLGLGGSAIFLPFEGYEFSALTVLSLVVSTFILFKNTTEQEKCKVKRKK